MCGLAGLMTRNGDAPPASLLQNLVIVAAVAVTLATLTPAITGAVASGVVKLKSSLLARLPELSFDFTR